MEYKCENCGGELRFDPTLGKLKCDFCGSTYDLDELEDEHDHDHDHAEHGDDQKNSPEAVPYAKATDDSTDVKEDLRAFVCPHCAAEVVTDKDTVATKCVFCGTPMLLDEQLKGSFTPSRVIPFEVDRKQIADLYEQYIRTKPFYPEEYSKANVIEKIRSVYLPFWLYDLKMSGQLQATGEITSTFTTGEWIITTHNVYQLWRQGEMDFHRIPAIASSRTPRDAMDALEPYDYSKLKDWNPGYLAGYLASRYDLDEQQNLDIARQRAESSFNQAMTGTLGGYQALRITGGQMDHSQVHPEYVLMPAYLLFMDYDQDADRLVAINGQTGRIVGNVPVDRRKATRFFLWRFAGLWLLFFAIAMTLMILID